MSSGRLLSQTEILQSAVNDAPWTVLREYADFLEESGNSEESVGWRWLIEHHKFPALDRTTWIFVIASKGEEAILSYILPSTVGCLVRDRVRDSWITADIHSLHGLLRSVSLAASEHIRGVVPCHVCSGFGRVRKPTPNGANMLNYECEACHGIGRVS